MSLFDKRLDLQLFAEGGDGGAAAEGVSQTPTGTNQEVSQNSTDGAAPAQRDLKAEFDKMVRGEFKGEFNSRVKEHVDKRVAGLRREAGKLGTMRPGLAMIAESYGVDPNDAEALNKAIMADDRWLQQKSAQTGQSIEEIRLGMRNQELSARIAQQEQEQASKARAGQWLQEAETLKARYPDFDFDEALEDEDFAQMLLATGSVKRAFFAMNGDSLIEKAASSAAQQATQSVAKSIASGAARPRENGTGGASGFSSVKSVASMTDQEIDDIMKRVRGGERISFG